MKKQIFISALALCTSGVFAQDLTSKKGEPYLPEAGDWALGVDATPALQYIGNFFGKSSSNPAPYNNFLSGDQLIIGKYFKDAQTAFRGGLRIGLQSTTTRTMVADRNYAATTTPTTVGNYPNTDPMVENTWKQSHTNIALTGGIEKRRGKTRLQGYYGGELGIGLLTGVKNAYTYGNALNTSTTAPVTVNSDDSFGNGNVVSSVPGLTGMLGNARITEQKTSATFRFGVRGFIGAEYFVLPKISIGGEFGWGLVFAAGGKTTTTYESIGKKDPAATTYDTGKTKVEGKGGGSFRLDTDNQNSLFGPAATLRLNFHF